jgi:hypothetical protein
LGPPLEKLLEEHEALRLHTSRLEDRLVQISKAFPVVGGETDFDGHRKAHEAMIRAAEAEENFWNGLKDEIIKKGILGLIIICLGLMFTGALIKLGVLLHQGAP